MKKITITHDDGTETVYPGGQLLTCAEVAALFGVNPSTVSRWGASGKLTRAGTPSHGRYLAGEVAGLLAATRRVRQP